MEAALCAPLPVGAAAGDIACAQAGVEIADTIIATNRKSRRRALMIPSPRLVSRLSSDTQKA
jgi:hypothetical protein